MRPGPPSHVYVIGGDAGPLKVGISHDPNVRLKHLRDLYGAHLHLLAFNHRGEGAARLVERLAHQLLATKQVRGEWFDVSLDEAKAAIEQAISSGWGSRLPAAEG